MGFFGGKKNKDKDQEQAPQAAAAGPLPEFHIVVKRPSRHGPLAPYRFAICVAVALFIGMRRGEWVEGLLAVLYQLYCKD